MSELQTLIENYRAAWERIVCVTGDVDEVNQFFPASLSEQTGRSRYSALRKTSAHSTVRDWNPFAKVA